MYIIELKNQQVHAHIGWGQEERDQGVRLLVSVQVQIDADIDNDDLKNSINYVDILNIVLSEAEKELKLLETFAKAISNKIKMLQVFGLKKIEVEIKKQQLPVIGYLADYASVCFIEDVK